jgi:hypothetical protein
MTIKDFKKVGIQFPTDRSFRVSVKVKKGSKQAYAYVTCLTVEQFFGWIKNNEQKFIEVVKVI